MNRYRAAATAAYIPLVCIFFAWAVIAGAMTRGPAGIAAFGLLAAISGAMGWQAYRVATGQSPVWGRSTKCAAGFDALFALYFTIAMPLLQSSFRGADEAATRTSLARMREAIGAAPPARLSMLVPEALPILPRLSLPGTGHPVSREVIFGPPSAAADRGVWLYDNDAASATFGSVIIDCTHVDAGEKIWSSY